ncbi:MAG: glycosyltransferase family A protein [Planctomycetota bacterium]|nr:glycosyltransferase family A protein [Planctomycetota bacterium]
MPGVAVIIPVFNRPDAVVECLDSVAAQTQAAEEIVVIDDGSTDHTPDAIRAWIASRSQGVLLQQQNAGASAARNTGVRATSEELLAFLDSDDIWPPDFLERAAQVLEVSPAAVAATADVDLQRPGRATKLRELGGLQQRPIRELFQGPGIGSATVIRRSALEACGGYNEDLATGHDLELYLELALSGSWLHVPGEPVTKREGVFGPRLSDRFSDRNVRWAQVYDDFGRAHPDADPDLARLIARRWFKVAQSLQRRGETEAAREAYRRTIAWRPLGLRARLALATLR